MKGQKFQTRILELSGQELEMDVHKEPCIDYYQTCQ